MVLPVAPKRSAHKSNLCEPRSVTIVSCLTRRLPPPSPPPALSPSAMSEDNPEEKREWPCLYSSSSVCSYFPKCIHVFFLLCCALRVLCSALLCSLCSAVLCCVLALHLELTCVHISLMLVYLSGLLGLPSLRPKEKERGDTHT